MFLLIIFSFLVPSSLFYKEVPSFENKVEETPMDMYSFISLPEEELEVLKRIAEKYGLNQQQTLLLFAIRKHEDGSPGKELGVLYIKKNGKIIKFNSYGFKDGKVSLVLQGEQAARIIKNRYGGDLKEFSERYAPIGVSNDPDNLNKYWYPRVKKYISAWEEELEREENE
jgi:hypothetical protein